MAQWKIVIWLPYDLGNPDSYCIYLDASRKTERLDNTFHTTDYEFYNCLENSEANASLSLSNKTYPWCRAGTSMALAVQRAWRVKTVLGWESIGAPTQCPGWEAHTRETVAPPALCITVSWNILLPIFIEMFKGKRG